MNRAARTADLLALSTIVTFAVIATGAAIGSTRPLDACSSWPLCTSDIGALLGGSGLLVLTHRVLTLVAGILLLVLVVTTVRGETGPDVRLPVYAGATLFPVQIVVGATLVLDPSVLASQVHLLVAVGIFLCLLFALGRTLSETTDRQASVVTGQRTPAVNNRHPSDGADQQMGGETGQARSASDSHVPGLAARLRGYLALTKPRLMWLLCLLALAGLALATMSGGTVDGVTVIATLAGGVLAIGASGTFNHVFEYERDRQMERTADRPVATARISRARATAFGLGLLVLSLAVMWLYVTPVATALTLVAVGYYSVVYTVVLKPNTSWNIAIGGGAGALPAVIGWAAVTGGVGLPALVLAAVVVIWTPAHFYNLAIVYREDYARAGYPMYPVVSGVPAARRRILSTLGATLLVTAALGAVSPLGLVFALSVVAAGAVFVWSVVVQFRQQTRAATLRSFHASNAYLGVVLVAIIVEAAITIT